MLISLRGGRFIYRHFSCSGDILELHRTLLFYQLRQLKGRKNLSINVCTFIVVLLITCDVLIVCT